jgi:hypothetical protein
LNTVHSGREPFNHWNIPVAHLHGFAIIITVSLPRITGLFAKIKGAAIILHTADLLIILKIAL